MNKPLRSAGGVLLVLSVLFCTWVMGGAVAYGWIAHADHYGAAFRTMGSAVFVCSGVMTLGTVLYFCRRDFAAAVCGAAGFLPLLCILLRAMHIAEAQSWSGQTAQSFGRQAADVWRNGLGWNALPFALLMLLALTRYFSADEKSRRAERRRKRDEAPAPSILGEEKGAAESAENRQD